MGGKHIQKRYKRIFQFTGSIFLIVLIFGCKAPTPPPVPKIELDRKAAKNYLLIAEDHISRMEFAQALSENGNAGEMFHENSLFQKGIIYCHPENPDKNYEKSIGYFAEILSNNSNISYAKDRPDTTEIPNLGIYNASFVITALIKTLSEKEKQLDTMTAKYQAENELAKSLKEKLNDLEGQIENLKEVDLNIEKKRNTMKQNTEGSEN